MSLPATYVFICRNSIPGSTGGYVAGRSASYENQAYVKHIAGEKISFVTEQLHKISLNLKLLYATGSSHLTYAVLGYTRRSVG